MLRYMLDLRDRTEWTPYEAQKGCSNWQTDMCAGTGLMMMALPDFPNRHTWLNNADMILKAQLELNVNPDSSSAGVHQVPPCGALERFAGYAKAVDNVMGENWFETTPLARMFGYSIEMQTPGYAFFEGGVETLPSATMLWAAAGNSATSQLISPILPRWTGTWPTGCTIPGRPPGSPSRGCGEKASFWRILSARGYPIFRSSLLHFVRPEIIRMRAFIFSGRTPGRETRATSPSCRVPSLSPTAIWTKAPSFCIRIPSRW